MKPESHPLEAGAAKALPHRAIIAAVLQIGISVSLLAWVLRHADLGVVESRLVQSDYSLLFFAFVVLIGQAALAACRWRLVNQELGPALGFGWHFRVTMVSLFFGQILPSTIGGDAYRLWAVARAGQKYATAILSVLSDRLIGMLALFVLSAAALPLSFERLGSHHYAFWSLVGVLAAGLGGYVVLALIGWLGARAAPGRWLAILLAPATAFCRLLAYRSFFIAQIGLGLAVHLCAVVAMVVLARAFGIAFSPAQALVIVPPVLLIISLPVSIAGWGLREGAMIGGLALFGLNSGEAAIISVSFGLISLGAGLVGSFFLLPVSRVALPR